MTWQYIITEHHSISHRRYRYTFQWITVIYHDEAILIFAGKCFVKIWKHLWCFCVCVFKMYWLCDGSDHLIYISRVKSIIIFDNSQCTNIVKIFVSQTLRCRTLGSENTAFGLSIYHKTNVWFFESSPKNFRY